MGLSVTIGERLAYLDANAFIYAVESVEPYAELLHPLFQDIEAGFVRAITSQLTVAEVLVIPMRARDARRQRAFAGAVRTRGGLSVEHVTRPVLIEAARLRSMLPSLRLPDAIHVATARLAGCGILITNDARMRAVPEPEVLLLSEFVQQ